ncbi:unnamed protein product [Rhodiola kirilowii]
MPQISISIFSAFPSYSSTNPYQSKSGESDRRFSFKRLLRHHQRRQQIDHDLLQCKVSRRDAASLLSFLALVPSLTHPVSAAAFSIGISGPKEWLKEQKKKASRFLLAPIDASRETLRYAYLMLTSEGSGSQIDFDDIQRLLGSAARDCVTKERNSFVEFQANTGVEVCTFRLFVNNAASLLDDKDPVKLEAEAKLDDVVRSFTLLYDVANQTNIQLSSDRVKVANALVDTISSLDKFEQGIKDCLDI